MEVELRKLEDLVQGIIENMEHLQAREERMRNTNGKAEYTHTYTHKQGEEDRFFFVFGSTAVIESLLCLYPQADFPLFLFHIVESTNARVQWFSTLTVCVLVALGLWQVFYLKRFFRKKRLID